MEERNYLEYLKERYPNLSLKQLQKRATYLEETKKNMVEFGVSRQIARNMVRQKLNPTKYIGQSPFVKNNLRKTRRERSKRLKVPFKPLYNGPVTRNTDYSQFNNKYVKFDEASGE